MRLATLLLGAALSLACRARSSSATDSHGEAHEDAEGRCQVSRQAGESADCYAVRCAEDFIQRNGYTTEPATGPQRRDAFDMPAGKRHALLYRGAIVHKWLPKGHSVGFRYRDSSDNVGRAVLMTEDFRDLQLDYLNLVWPPDSRLPHCNKDAG